MHYMPRYLVAIVAVLFFAVAYTAEGYENPFDNPEYVQKAREALEAEKTPPGVDMATQTDPAQPNPPPEPPQRPPPPVPYRPQHQPPQQPPPESPQPPPPTEAGDNAEPNAPAPATTENKGRFTMPWKKNKQTGQQSTAQSKTRFKLPKNPFGKSKKGDGNAAAADGAPPNQHQQSGAGGSVSQESPGDGAAAAEQPNAVTNAGADGGQPQAGPSARGNIKNPFGRLFGNKKNPEIAGTAGAVEQAGAVGTEVTAGQSDAVTNAGSEGDRVPSQAGQAQAGAAPVGNRKNLLAGLFGGKKKGGKPVDSGATGPTGQGGGDSSTAPSTKGGIFAKLQKNLLSKKAQGNVNSGAGQSAAAGGASGGAGSNGPPPVPARLPKAEAEALFAKATSNEQPDQVVPHAANAASNGRPDQVAPAAANAASNGQQTLNQKTNAFTALTTALSKFGKNKAPTGGNGGTGGGSATPPTGGIGLSAVVKPFHAARSSITSKSQAAAQVFTSQSLAFFGALQSPLGTRKPRNGGSTQPPTPDAGDSTQAPAGGKGRRMNLPNFSMSSVTRPSLLKNVKMPSLPKRKKKSQPSGAAEAQGPTFSVQQPEERQLV